jgi:hypothetical protein
MDAKEDAVGEMGASSRLDGNGDVGGDVGIVWGSEGRERDSNAFILDCNEAAGIAVDDDDEERRECPHVPDFDDDHDGSE